MNTVVHRTDRRDNMLLAARGTAGQLLFCSVLVWRAALRTVTLFCTHTHTQGMHRPSTYMTLHDITNVCAESVPTEHIPMYPLWYELSWKFSLYLL